MNTITSAIDTLIGLALSEDLDGPGDVTSRFFILPSHESVGDIVSREECVVSGMRIVERVFDIVDADLVVEVVHDDGEAVAPGQVVLSVRGRTRSILTAERTALNFLQRLSGIATITSRYCREVQHTDVKLLDTRKTTPGWRGIEKQAVVHGGGHNHRMGLFDAVMIKDNHLVASSGPTDLANGISEIRQRYPDIPVIVEADNLDQVEVFLRLASIDRILLDNMPTDKLTEAVGLRDRLRPNAFLEASGGVTLETVAQIAETGVDFISVGALTHSVISIDLGMDLRDMDR